MRIGVIGAGNMGSAIGRAWARAGHAVTFSGARTAEALAEAAAAAGPGAATGTPEEAVRDAEVVLISLWPFALDGVLPAAERFDGRIVVTCMSGIRPDFRGETVGLPSDLTVSVAEALQARLPGARVVEAFNLTFAEILASDARGFGDLRPTLPVVGDDAAAKEVVAGLVRDAGYEPLDAGALRHARVLETMASAWVQLAVVAGLHPGHGLRILSPTA